MLLDYQWDLQDALPPEPGSPTATVARESRAIVVDQEEREATVREPRVETV